MVKQAGNKNTNLNAAKSAKYDEFYTQMTDIERELQHYWQHFKDKTVLCNCDDPTISNFFLYFVLQFHTLGLKKLITTCWKNTNPNLFSKGLEEHAVYMEYNGEFRSQENAKIQPFVAENCKRLQGDGDFRSNECIELLKQADIVCTNPPFSLLRPYISQLTECSKKFIVIGSDSAITYKEIFPLIKENKIWRGINSGAKTYYKPDGTTQTMGNTGWYTNLDVPKRHEMLTLYKHYNPEEYPKYDNYDAIETYVMPDGIARRKTFEIPCDYDGLMGVPITFLDKYNPEQFEIVGNAGCYAPDGYSLHNAIYVNRHKIYKRIIIRRR